MPAGTGAHAIYLIRGKSVLYQGEDREHPIKTGDMKYLEKERIVNYQSEDMSTRLAILQRAHKHTQGRRVDEVDFRQVEYKALRPPAEPSSRASFRRGAV